MTDPTPLAVPKTEPKDRCVSEYRRFSGRGHLWCRRHDSEWPIGWRKCRGVALIPQEPSDV